MENNNEDMAYILAKHKAERLKRFYTHAIIYSIVNIILIVVKVYYSMENGAAFLEAIFNWSAFSTAIIWGIVLAIHAYSVYGANNILGARWEERKIK